MEIKFIRNVNDATVFDMVAKDRNGNSQVIANVWAEHLESMCETQSQVDVIQKTGIVFADLEVSP